jgi:hypothetical protein
MWRSTASAPADCAALDPPCCPPPPPALQAEALLLPQLAPRDFLQLLAAEPWLLEPGALLGSLQGLQDALPGREPCGVLLHHARSSSSRLLQDFKQQALAQVGLR